MSKILTLKEIISNKSDLIKSLMEPSHLDVFLKNLFKKQNNIVSDDAHLKAAIDWLCLAQDVTGCGGVSGGYRITTGWRNPYPETTGYIISTFLNYYKLIDNEEYLRRALKMGDWEVEIQLPSGGVRGGVGVNKEPVIFNTGQVILGWIDLFNEARNRKYLDAAVKAANWLIDVQDDDGKWSKYTYENIPHNYHSRVAWPLLTVYEVTGEKKYKTAAEKNIRLTLGYATQNGWFRQMAFKLNEKPFTHTIAYTLRGLLGSSSYLEKGLKEEILGIVRKASENIISKHNLSKPDSSNSFLPGTLDEKWESTDKYTCLTGNAQLSIIWMILYGFGKDSRLKIAAFNLIDYLKGTQSLKSRNSGLKGSIAGSYPIWGKYQQWAYPNWATKFFADALLLKKKIQNE